MIITYYPIYKAKVRETLFDYLKQLLKQRDNNDAPSLYYTKIFGTNSGANNLARLIDFISSTIAMIDYIDSQQLPDKQKFKLLRGALIVALDCVYNTSAYRSRAQVEHSLASNFLLWQVFQKKLATIGGPTSVQLSTMPTFHLVARLFLYTQLIEQLAKQAGHIRIDSLLTRLLSDTTQEDEQELLKIMLTLYKEGIYNYLKHYATADQHFCDAYENYELFGFVAAIGETTGLNYTTPKADEAAEVYYQFCQKNKLLCVKTAEDFKIKEAKPPKPYVPPHQRDPNAPAARNRHSWYNKRKPRGTKMRTRTSAKPKQKENQHSTRKSSKH